MQKIGCMYVRMWFLYVKVACTSYISYVVYVMQAGVDAVTAGVDLEDANFHDFIVIRNAFTYLSDAVNQVGNYNVSRCNACGLV